MLYTKDYDRERALSYARKWAFERNPLFRDYTGFGGNCTNFVSQAVYAGSCVMNYTPLFGWYYRSDGDRTPSWTGVQFFYNFMTENMGVGPFAVEVEASELEVGDVIQLFREGTGYYHTLLVTGFDESGYLVAAQSDDAFDRPLATYTYDSARFLHILGVRVDLPPIEDCFAPLLEGTALIANDEERK